MKNKRKSIKFTISTSFIVLMIITFSTICYLVFSSWKTTAEDIVNREEDRTRKDIINRIDEFLNSALQINENNHGFFEEGLLDISAKEKREIYFSNVLKASSDEVYSFSYGTAAGEYYGARKNQSNGIEIMENNAESGGKTRYYALTGNMTAGELLEETGKFDPRTRDWYMAAEKSKKPIFSAVYKHFVMNDLALSAAYPIYDRKGQLQGVLGTHITLSKINRFLRQITQDNDATAYLLERSTGQLVGNSLELQNFKMTEDRQINRFTLQDMGDPTVLEAYRFYLEHKDSGYTYTEKGSNLHVTMTRYVKNGLDWLIIAAIPEGIYISRINRSIELAFGLSVIALLIAIAMYRTSIGFVLKPIFNLIKTTEKFTTGDFSARADILRNDEIGMLSTSFNRMSEQLAVLINNLEEKVRERTAELETANTELKRSEEDIRLLLDSTAEAIYGVDMYGNCTFCNASCIRILGYHGPEDLIGKNMHALIHYMKSDGTPVRQEECRMFSAVRKGEGSHGEGEILWKADGTGFPVEYYSYPQERNGDIIGAVVTFLDISERKKSEEEILYLSYHDQLTGLYNRRYFEEELKRLDRPDCLPLTLVMADMNGLKLVNDSLGHTMGDEMLKRVALVLKKGCREKDLVARLGGDEFVLVLPSTKGSEAERIIRRIKEQTLSEKVGSVDLSISFGYETRSRMEEKLQDILKKAEDSMYKFKLFESPSMRSRTVRTIIGTLNEKNSMEEAHYRRVSQLCGTMGELMHLPGREVEELRNLGLLHDIGKIAIDESILRKQGPLSEEEWEEIRRHPEIGYRILSTVNEMAEMAGYVLAHHERWDGKGYPKQLKGEEIPIQSRIIALADAFDAMTGENSYRKPLKWEAAVEELRRNAGSQFDPELTELFVEKVLYGLKQ